MDARVVLALLALMSAGCGECLGSFQVKGAVQNQTAHPLEGVRITACDSEERVSGEGHACRTVVSDANGRFAIESRAYRVNRGRCSVHALWLEKPGCRTTRQTMEAGSPAVDEQTVTIPCGESPPGVEPATPPKVAPPATGGVAARITASGEALAVETRNAVGWQPVCTTDCSVVLDPAARYRVRGVGFASSEPFSVPANRGALSIEVKPGRDSRVALGSYLGWGGMWAMGVGGGLALGGALMSSGTPDHDRTGTKVALKTSGLIILGVGLVAAAVGFPLGYFNTMTSVEVHPLPR